jgi:hypothetical protein
MRHLNPELEKLEQRVAPGLLDIGGDVEAEISEAEISSVEAEIDAELSSSAEVEAEVEVEVG